MDVHASEALIAADAGGRDRRQRERAEDARRTSRGCKALGYRAFLIGERFMTAADPGEQLKELLASAAETEDTKATKDTEKRPHRLEVKS